MTNSNFAILDLSVGRVWLGLADTGRQPWLFCLLSPTSKDDIPPQANSDQNFSWQGVLGIKSLVSEMSCNILRFFVVHILNHTASYLSLNYFYGDIFDLDLCQLASVHQMWPQLGWKQSPVSETIRISADHIFVIPLYSYVETFYNNPCSNDDPNSGQSWDFKMKMSKSLRVFESSIIRSEKLFNLISQVKHMHKIKKNLGFVFLTKDI